MKTIKQRNGIFYLYDFDEVPEWVTESKDGKKYFPLNCVTRDLFKRDLLPLCKSGEIQITQEEKYKIRDFVQNPIHSAKPIVVPAGIKLLKHQQMMADLISKHHKYGFFAGPGTGKTITAITAILTYKPESVLVVTPKSVVKQYENEIIKYVGALSSLHIKVINFESLHQIKYEHYQMLIIDEAHKAKNFMSETNQNLRHIAQYADYIYLFTGTPQDKSRHEILPQLAILDQRVMPIKGRIYDRYFAINDYFQPTKEIKNFSDELTEIIKCYTWGIKTEDAIKTMPENNVKVICGEPDPYYKRLKEDRIIHLNGGHVICENKATLRIKLREICCGHLNVEYTRADLSDTGDIISVKETKTVRVYNSKAGHLKAAMDLYKRGIIYTEFAEDIKIVCQIATMNNYTWGTLQSNEAKIRQEVINFFKSGVIDFLILNTKSGGTGLDLSCTNNVIFYSLPESYILFQQCKARIQRYGQTETCNYCYLLCKNSIEEQQYSALLKKKSFNNKVFNVYK